MGPPPSIFVPLIESGLVSDAELAPLLSRLPEEHYVRTGARGGEAFDSARWPLRCDAELARLAASRMPSDPRLSAALAELDATTDRERLRMLSDEASVRLLIATGMPKELVPHWYGPHARREVLDEPPWPQPLTRVLPRARGSGAPRAS